MGYSHFGAVHQGITHVPPKFILVNIVVTLDLRVFAKLYIYH